MNFLIDAHLPECICKYFKGGDCIHTINLEQGNYANDSFINELSIREKRAVITKDIDFYYSYITSRKPYKLILVRFGNMRLIDLKRYFENNCHRINTLIEVHSFIILEKETIRIIE